MNLLQNSMQDIADVIIRPARHLYKLSDLGPKVITVENQSVIRQDFQVKNKRNLTLKCSLYSKNNGCICNDVLIYLHCNSGCRIEGLSYLKFAIQQNFSFLVFDFCGSGLSQGKYVSLGFYQVQDLQAVIKYVKTTLNQEARISIWGRSMGAVTALRYLSVNKHDIKAAIFDSPFQSLKQLFIEIGKQRTNLPEILLNVAYSYVQPIIKQKANFNIDDVTLEQLIDAINVPGIFIASKLDQLIPFSQIDDIFNKYKGQKQMFFIEESHNEARNTNVIKKVFKAIRKFLYFDEPSNHKNQKTNYFSTVPIKNQSKKKLQLTLKSLSQRNLKKQIIKLDKKQNNEIQSPVLQKRQGSCLFPINKCKKDKKPNEFFYITESDIFLNSKRKPLNQKNIIDDFVSDFEEKKPKFTGPAKVVQIKMNKQKKKSRERKTLQHISSKRPPFVQIKGVKELRNSFQARYRT